LVKLVVPKLLENKGVRDTVRVWVPGCATGEEVYSIAIVLREHMEKLPAAPKVQIFATDIDDSALSIARTGRYPAPLMGHVSKERLERFFEADDVTYSVSKDVRDLCMFSAHSLIRDPPFSRIDLVSCRNLLIYFGTDFQATAIPVFHFALKPNAYLFLGTSENVSQFGDLFAPIDKKHRIFQRRNHVTAPLRFPLFTPQGRNVPSPEARRETAAMADNVRRTVENRIAERHAPAHVVVDRDGNILHYSPRTGKYLEPAMGMPTRHILEMARRGLRLDLRNALNEALEKRRSVERANIAFDIDDRVQTLNLVVEPFGENEGDPLFLVVFNDVGIPRRPMEPHLESADGDDGGAAKRLETELRETRDRLQASIEEYESGVEELNSTNEELQSMNEELQSTNEELETSKEELQSVNEELQTVNSELLSKMEELDRANSDLKNILDSTQVATIFLDRNMVIRNFTSSATAVFNLIPSDLGRPLTDIVSRLDENGELHKDIRGVLDKGKLVERRVRRADGGAHYLMRILPYSAGTSGLEGALVTFVEVTKLVEAEAHQKSLVAELNHRVRNVLTIVGAIARQTLAKKRSPTDFADAFMGRIQAMSRTYTLVSREEWGEVALTDILNNELAVNGKQRVTYDGPPVSFRASSALALSVVFHELVTNATKHGALSTPKGRVALHWAMRAASAKALVMTWDESAGRAIKKPSAKGFGLELIERELKGTLGAEIKFNWGARGLKAQITIPADPRRFTIRTADRT
jgi:two-component system CheB/CheR fusion protein